MKNGLNMCWEGPRSQWTAMTDFNGVTAAMKNGLNMCWENDFSVTLTMDKVQKEKICRYPFIEEYGSKSFSFFLFGYFWQKYKNIGLAKIFYIILFQKQMVNFLHWWINFFI